MVVRSLHCCMLALAAVTRVGAGDLDLRKLFQDGIPPSPWMEPVYRHANAWLEQDIQRRAFDHDLVRVLIVLRSTSSEVRFERSADEALRSLLREGSPVDFVRPWLLWERAFELEPAQARRQIEAAFPTGGNGAGAVDSAAVRKSGFALRAWAEAHARTGDASFLAAIDSVLREYVGADGPAIAARGGSPAAILSLAIDCAGAARKVPPATRYRLSELASRLDAAFLAAPHDLRRGRGFARSFASDAALTLPWEPGTNGETTARVAVACASRLENGAGWRFRELITAAAEAYLDLDPAETVDPWPQTFGNAITLQLAAFRITTREEFLRRAIRLGEVARMGFYDPGPFPRASLRASEPSNATGGGTLALALVELHLTVRGITAVRAPANTAAR